MCSSIIPKCYVPKIMYLTVQQYYSQMMEWRARSFEGLPSSISNYKTFNSHEQNIWSWLRYFLTAAIENAYSGTATRHLTLKSIYSIHRNDFSPHWRDYLLMIYIQWLNIIILIDSRQISQFKRWINSRLYTWCDTIGYSKFS